MKNQAVFSPKDKSKKLKCRMLQFLFRALGFNIRASKIITVTVIKKNILVLQFRNTLGLKCLSIGTPKTINFPFVPNGKLMLFRCPNIEEH